MEWNRSETLALARPACTACRGTGIRLSTRKTMEGPCSCVLRAVFRACFNRFRNCADQGRHISQATLQRTSGKDTRQIWGRRDEEFIADFCLVARRTLSPSDYRIFKFHFLLGGDWKLCCRQLGMERGIFFHSIYRIQEDLGRVFRELEPYGLFPLDEYFGGTIQKALPEAYCKLRVTPCPVGPARHRLVIPIRKVA